MEWAWNGAMWRRMTAGVVAAAAVMIGVGIAPPADAAPTTCQTVSLDTVCAPGGQSGGSSSDTSAASIPPASSGCTNQYGTYQHC